MQPIHNASTLAMSVEAGVTLLLFAVPFLVICTAIILRCTRRFSEEAEAVVKSAEESHIAAFLEKNGPAIIRRIGDARQVKLSGGQGQIPLIEDGEVIDIQEPEEGEEDEYGRDGLESELRTVIKTRSPVPAPDPAPADPGGQEPEESDFEAQFKPLT
jgi:hypothetical protein